MIFQVAKLPRLANRYQPKVAKNATIPNNKFVISMECLRIMEATPTFALPNQFLVWVAKKVLVQSDLDLVLTDYYEERLESRLENRETHTTEYISTEPTEPKIPIDFAYKALNYEATSAPSYTSSFSSILPSPSTQSITPVPCCHKNNYSSLQPNVTQCKLLLFQSVPMSSPQCLYERGKPRNYGY